jgi:hypothetical protein
MISQVKLKNAGVLQGNVITRWAFLRGVSALGVAALCCGCMSLENEEGRLPNAMRSAIAGFTAKGYPDLTKLPDAPTGLPSANAWSALEAGLVKQGQQLGTNPAAVALKPEDSDLRWAQVAKSEVEANPLSQPLVQAPSGTPTELENAAAARAKFDADLARLPPL